MKISGQNTLKKVVFLLLLNGTFTLQMMRKLLSNIELGKCVTISMIQDSALRPKLVEMGLVNGSPIKILFRAPLGDPIAVEVKEYVLSLRLDEARLIEVEE